MANMLFANNANTTLSSSLSNSATSMSVTSATGFPSPTGVQYFYCTLADAATQTTIEIVKVTSVSGTTFAITRAQDGTSATAFAAGAVVSLRLVRASLNDFPKLDETNTFNADQSITGQLTTSAGMATTGQFTATAPSNGVVTDVISGYGRFSTFSSNGFQWFTGGIGTTKLMQLSSSGVITTATWNGATVGVAYGGTGVTSATGTGAGASVVLSQAPAINSPVITAYSTSTVPLKVYGLSGQITELFDVYTYNGGTLAFQINSSGAITTGTWNGATVGTGYGGTGLTSFTANGVMYASSTSALTTGAGFTYDGTNLLFSNATYGGTNSIAMNLIGRTSTFNTHPLGYITIQTDPSTYAQGVITFGTTVSINSNDPVERMRIDSSGNLLVGTTSAPAGSANIVGTKLWGSQTVSAGIYGSNTPVVSKSAKVGQTSLTFTVSMNQAFSGWEPAHFKLYATSTANTLTGNGTAYYVYNITHYNGGLASSVVSSTGATGNFTISLSTSGTNPFTMTVTVATTSGYYIASDIEVTSYSGVNSIT
jgi:hypothetical protein